MASNYIISKSRNRKVNLCIEIGGIFKHEVKKNNTLLETTASL